MTINVTPSGTGLTWKSLFKTLTIEIGTGFFYIYSPSDKNIYVAQRDENNQTILTVFDSRSGKKSDSRVYSHYFNSFFEVDGYAYMTFYNWTEQCYLQARLLGTAITSVSPYNPPQ